MCSTTLAMGMRWRNWLGINAGRGVRSGRSGLEEAQWYAGIETLEIEKRGAVGRATRMRGTAGSSELIRCQNHAMKRNNNSDCLGAISW